VWRVIIFDKSQLSQVETSQEESNAYKDGIVTIL